MVTEDQKTHNHNHEEIIIFGETNYRNIRRKFGIKTDDRRRHMYLIGKTGTGKTTTLENMIYQDIQAGHGVAVVDPHGDLAEKALDFVPPRRVNETIYFNPGDIDYPIAFNILENVDPVYRHFVASGLIGVFKKIWADSWGPRLEYVLRNAILALLEYPGSTLLGIMRILVDKDFRKKVVDRLTDPIVKSFWVDEFSRYPDRFQAEAVAPIQNKVGQFLSMPLIRNIVGQVKSKINLREVMDEGKILILNLSKGRIGEDASSLMGAMMITKMQMAAMSRIDTPEEERRDFYLYVDEFQNFATESFANILSEARKYRLNLILAHQYIAQLDERVRSAIFGNVGTIICFRVGAEDAAVLAKEFYPPFDEIDLVNLNKYEVYVKLMIDGITSQPFSAVTLPPIGKSEHQKEKIIKLSRERYAESRKIVEEKIMRWSGMLEEGGAPQRAKFESKCDNCGVTVFVPFIPDGVRPVLCKKCLKKFRQQQTKQIKEEQPPEEKELSLTEAIKKEPTKI
jgi:CxxC-x17-CxxC domain-containing protein